MKEHLSVYINLKVFILEIQKGGVGTLLRVK